MYHLGIPNPGQMSRPLHHNTWRKKVGSGLDVSYLTNNVLGTTALSEVSPCGNRSERPIACILPQHLAEKKRRLCPTVLGEMSPRTHRIESPCSAGVSPWSQGECMVVFAWRIPAYISLQMGYGRRVQGCVASLQAHWSVVVTFNGQATHNDAGSGRTGPCVWFIVLYRGLI